LIHLLAVLVLITLSSLDQGIDSITDFSVSDCCETIGLLPLVLGWANCRTPITAAQFKLGTAASDASDRFIYDNTGALFFDVDGTGGSDALQQPYLLTCHDQCSHLCHHC